MVGWACCPGRELAHNEWISAIRAALAAGRSLPVPPPGAPGPFGLADDAQIRAFLDRAGFADVEFQRVDEVVNFGVDAEDAYAFVAGMGVVHGLSEDLDAAARAQALENLHATLAAHETADGVLFGSSAWLITARRDLSAK